MPAKRVKKIPHAAISAVTAQQCKRKYLQNNKNAWPSWLFAPQRRASSTGVGSIMTRLIRNIWQHRLPIVQPGSSRQPKVKTRLTREQLQQQPTASCESVTNNGTVMPIPDLKVAHWDSITIDKPHNSYVE
jgi:hypothetical protein